MLDWIRKDIVPKSMIGSVKFSMNVRKRKQLRREVRPERHELLSGAYAKGPYVHTQLFKKALPCGLNEASRNSHFMQFISWAEKWREKVQGAGAGNKNYVPNVLLCQNLQWRKRVWFYSVNFVLFWETKIAPSCHGVIPRSLSLDQTGD